jgi:hypothetical protein
VQIKDSANEDTNRLINLPESPAAQELQDFDIVLRYIEKCNREQSIDKKIQLLKFINSVIPKEIQLSIPSLITDDYVESALSNLEMACRGRIKLRNHFLLSL